MGNIILEQGSPFQAKRLISLIYKEFLQINKKKLVENDQRVSTVH